MLEWQLILVRPVWYGVGQSWLVVSSTSQGCRLEEEEEKEGRRERGERKKTRQWVGNDGCDELFYCIDMGEGL